MFAITTKNEVSDTKFYWTGQAWWPVQEDAQLFASEAEAEEAMEAIKIDTPMSVEGGFDPPPPPQDDGLTAEQRRNKERNENISRSMAYERDLKSGMFLDPWEVDKNPWG